MLLFHYLKAELQDDLVSPECVWIWTAWQHRQGGHPTGQGRGDCQEQAQKSGDANVHLEHI